MDDLSINIVLSNRDSFVLRLFALQADSLFEVEDAEEFGEAPYQLKEGCRYDFELDTFDYYLANTGIFVNSRSGCGMNHGHVSTGTFVGTHYVDILEREGNRKVGCVGFEIRSSKVGYRDDYRWMLEDITGYCTELLLSQEAVVVQKFEVDISEDPRSEYQRFAFVRSIVESEAFADALHQIQVSPVKRWMESEEEKLLCNVKRMGYRVLKQLSNSSNRIGVPHQHSLWPRFESLPRRVCVASKTETVDIAENRFVKYVLRSFLVFCSSIQRHPKAGRRLRGEAERVCERLVMYLSFPLFRGVSEMDMLPLNSPVLQKKEGYREIFQKWLMFDMAARLTWQGGDNVYEAGKKNVAALYEYWLFFKLLDVLSNKFHIPAKSKSELIECRDGVLNLNLKQGRTIVLGGVYETESRRLNVQFSYNRTFGYTGDYQSAGSWTHSFRPDYTLSLWPGEITCDQAEREELITHIHFDAKYRVERLFLSDGDMEGDSDEWMSRIEEEEERGMYRRADLLKMHAYKDAIRRTGGAYVLYPGTEDRVVSGFHEIIPGLGAFAISPKHGEKCLLGFVSFLDDVINNFLDRTSQREKLAYHVYSTLQGESTNLREPLPEPYGGNRDLLPDETYVLIGYYKDREHLDWIFKSRLYNTRTGTGNGSLRLHRKFILARYLLLHGPLGQHFVKLDARGPRVLSKQNIMDKGYPGVPGEEYYIVFGLDVERTESEFGSMRWDVSKVCPAGHRRAIPRCIVLSELMKYRVRV